MKTLLLIISFLISPISQASLPLLDKELAIVEKEVVKEEMDGLRVIYKVGLYKRDSFLKQIRDLADFDKVLYEVKEEKNDDKSLKITILFKNGVLLEEALVRIQENLP